MSMELLSTFLLMPMEYYFNWAWTQSKREL